MKTTVLVVDDEPLARRKLASLLADVPWACQVGEASNGREAIECVARLKPQVVFLDVVMPELSGLQVAERLRELPVVPAVVFTTAHDDYAVAAFELEAVDYLLKPFGQGRFLSALARARQSALTHEARLMIDRAREVLEGRRIALERILVRDGHGIVSIDPADIENFEAQGDYVMIHTRERRRHLVHLPIQEIERRLTLPPFLRVHRSHVVNLNHAERLAQQGPSRFEVCMRSGMRVPVSRTRLQAVKQLVRCSFE